MTGPPADPVELVARTLWFANGGGGMAFPWPPSASIAREVYDSRAVAVLDALADAGLLASGGSGEAPAGLSLNAFAAGIETRADLGRPYSLQEMRDLAANLRSALRGPVGGKPPGKPKRRVWGH